LQHCWLAGEPRWPLTPGTKASKPQLPRTLRLQAAQRPSRPVRAPNQPVLIRVRWARVVQHSRMRPTQFVQIRVAVAGRAAEAVLVGKRNASAGGQLVFRIDARRHSLTRRPAAFGNHPGRGSRQAGNASLRRAVPCHSCLASQRRCQQTLSQPRGCIGLMPTGEAQVEAGPILGVEDDEAIGRAVRGALYRSDTSRHVGCPSGRYRNHRNLFVQAN
jgi:hypothetical protein